MTGEMDKTGLLASLKKLSISCETIEHEAVMTCEAQAEALQGISGVVTKNLLLKDKKSRIFLVTAEKNTRVDLKVLSARLGTGKGGVRMAPDELLGTLLQVPLGSCTPLALCRSSSANVVLLLDQKLQGQSCICVHPLENTATTILSSDDLERFLRSLGREPVYVDLEAEPVIDRDTPPDLKAIADAAVPYTTESDAEEQPPKASAGPQPATSSKRATVTAAKTGQKASPASRPRGDDVIVITDNVIHQVLSRAMGDAAASLDAELLRQLTADVLMELNALRNAAYSNGFSAAKGAVAASISKAYA